MQLPLEPGRSTPTTTPRLMMLDLINAALPTWQDAVPDLGHWDSIRDWDADSAGNGESHGRMAIGNCARLLGKQRRQDEPHCHLLMMIIYCPEGLMGASDPLRPALGFPDPASWAPWRKRFPLRPASGVGKYLPWLSISPARPNKLFTIFIVCSMFCGR